VAAPAETPVTTPAELTVAIAGDALLHDPPVVASFNDVVPAGQIVVVPLMLPAFAKAFTVTTVVAVNPPAE
jgi:hypothetical protein